MKLEHCNLGDIAALKYGKSLPERVREPGPYPVYGSSGVVGSHSSFCVEGPGIVVGRKGSIGTVYFEEDPFFPIDTVYYAVPTWPDISHRSLYYILQLAQLHKLNTDAAVPGLNRTNALSVKVTFPQREDDRERVADQLAIFDRLMRLNNIRTSRPLSNAS